MKKLYRIFALAMLSMLCVGCEICDQGETYEKWPGGVIPYFINGDFTDEQILIIIECIDEINTKTNISFVQLEKKLDMFTENCCIIKSSEKRTYTTKIGMSFRNIVYLNKNKSFNQIRDNILHELFHVAGATHEHQRKDRDKYIEIVWENIKIGYAHNFYIKENPFIDYTKWPYDYKSIMHYIEIAFSKTDAPTIIIKDGTQIPWNKSITQMDIEKINVIYEKL